MNFGRQTTQAEPATTATNLLGSCLLLVDGSEPCVTAAGFAIELAKQTGSRITAVYVVDTATMDYLMQMHIFVKEEREEFETDLEHSGQRYLEYVATIGRKLGVPLETVLRKGRFHSTIIQEARTLAVDAIVVGGWRRSVTRKDVASIERQLIPDQADCPVLVVKCKTDLKSDGA
jgi:nucleotide-binding universal stress UspA family protein